MLFTRVLIWPPETFKKKNSRRLQLLPEAKGSIVVSANMLRQNPLEAILVVFGRRALTFFLFERSWKNRKNDTTSVRLRSGDHLGDAKMSKKGTSLRRLNFFINCD